MHSPSKQRIPTDSTPVLFLRRTCEQIECEVQNLLSTMAAEKLTEINLRSIEKYISSFKQAIIRCISSRLPSILAAEEKYHALISQVNEEAETQKKKMKEIYAKYEQNILENDRLKIETVTVNDLYEESKRQIDKLNAKIETMGLQLMEKQSYALSNQEQNQEKSLKTLNQHKTQTYEFGVQAVQSSVIMIEKADYQKIIHKLEEQKEQKQLYHEELAKNCEEIDELKSNLLTANHRIEQLQTENKEIIFNNESQHQSQKMLKNQIGSLLVQIQEQNHVIEGLEEEMGKIKMSMKEVREKKEQCEKQKVDLREEIEKKELEMEERAQKLERIIKEKQQIIQKFEEMVERKNMQNTKKDEKIVKLEKQSFKLNELSKQKQQLENKFNLKFSLMNKQIKQLSDKSKHYKGQNERLYTAMDQYASNEVKMEKKMQELQKTLKKNQSQIEALEQKKIGLRAGLEKMMKEVKSVKKQFRNQWLSKNLVEMVEEVTTVCEQIHQKISRKIQMHCQEQKRSLNQAKEKLSIVSQEYKELQQKCLESEINSGKVASSLLDAKRQITKQVLQKDQMIRSLEAELQREKEINEDSLKKLGEVASKYQKYTCENRQHPSSSGCSFDSELERRMEAQRSRFMDLQKEYHKMLQG